MRSSLSSVHDTMLGNVPLCRWYCVFDDERGAHCVNDKAWCDRAGGVAVRVMSLTDGDDDAEGNAQFCVPPNSTTTNSRRKSRSDAP